MPTSSAQRRQRHPRWWIVSMVSPGTWGDCLWRWPHVERECVALAQEGLYLFASKGRCFKGPQENQNSQIWMEVSSGTDWSTMVGQQSGYLWGSQCSAVLGQNGCTTAPNPVFFVPWSGLGVCLCGWFLLDPSSIQCTLAYTCIVGSTSGIGDPSQLEEDSALRDQHMVGIRDQPSRAICSNGKGQTCGSLGLTQRIGRRESLFLPGNCESPGKIQWATATCPMAKPFLQPFWAWKSAVKTAGVPGKLVNVTFFTMVFMDRC